MANCTNPLSAEMKDYLKTMGAVVRNERLQQNWSGAELAKRAGVGVNTIWNIENGNGFCFFEECTIRSGCFGLFRPDTQNDTLRLLRFADAPTRSKTRSTTCQSNRSETH